MNTVSFDTTSFQSVVDIERAISVRNSHSVQSILVPLSDAVCGNSITIGTDSAKIYFGTISSLRTRGIISNNSLNFGASLSTHPKNTFLGEQFKSGYVAVVPSGCEHEIVHYHDSQFIILTLSGKYLNQRLPILEDRLGHRIFEKTNIFKVNNNIATYVASQLIQARSTIINTPELLSSSEGFTLAFCSLLELLLGVIEAAEEMGEVRRPSPNFYSDILMKTEELVMDKGTEIPTMGHISTELGLSQRTIHRVFKNMVGVGPNTFVRNLRLAGARKDLLSKDAVTVTQIAHEWAFWELGRFSQYYKQMFGELPSETIQRSL